PNLKFCLLTIISAKCTPISKGSHGTEVGTEFILIKCNKTVKGASSTSKEYQAIVFDPEDYSNSTKLKVDFWRHSDRSPSGENIIPERPPNVLIIGIDSVSRLHMRRSLPRLVRFLKENDFVEMRGYTRIGVNTFPNMMGVLGGMERYKYPCWARPKNKFDDCPLIWKNFSRNNYITALIEDHAEIAIFNYIKTGFVEQPVDYYFRPISVAYKKKLISNKCNFGVPETEIFFRLTNPMDLHATLEDILSLSTAFQNFTYTHLNWSPKFRKTYSLFEETPRNRTCISSGIREDFCRCGVNQTINIKAKIVNKMGYSMISEINSILADEISMNICVSLKFKTILYVRDLNSGEGGSNLGKTVSFRDFLVAVEAAPSGGRFEASFRVFENKTMKILGEVNRVNSYHGQSECLQDYKLQAYCLCKDYYENSVQ
ncbi:unnamed protein product, partial [Allacma fusca]